VLRRPVEPKQYAAHDYRRLLDEHGMLCSMSRKGNCWDNAPMESFFSSLKTELDDDPFETRQAARTAFFGFLEGFYNRQRGTQHSVTSHQIRRNRSQQPRRQTRVHKNGGRPELCRTKPRMYRRRTTQNRWPRGLYFSSVQRRAHAAREAHDSRGTEPRDELASHRVCDITRSGATPSSAVDRDALLSCPA